MKKWVPLQYMYAYAEFVLRHSHPTLQLTYMYEILLEGQVTWMDAFKSALAFDVGTTLDSFEPFLIDSRPRALPAVALRLEKNQPIVGSVA